MSSGDLRAVTFDFGQTLAEIDCAMLARRLAERDVVVGCERLEAVVGAGWHAYNAAVRAGLGGHPWAAFMDALLASAGVEARRAEVVEWLWTEQPRANLWRKPIAGMIEVVRDLNAAGVPVAVVSNSEGRLAELIDEMGWGGDLRVVADSGRLGMEKPGAEIFRWAAERLGVDLSECAHVGDAWSADFVGALGAGMRAVLFRGRGFVPEGDDRVRHPRAAVCDEAEELRAVLRGWGLPA